MKIELRGCTEYYSIVSKEELCDTDIDDLFKDVHTVEVQILDLDYNDNDEAVYSVCVMKTYQHSEYKNEH